MKKAGLLIILKSVIGLSLPIFFFVAGCQKDGNDDIDFRGEMVNFISAIASYAHDSLGATNFGIFPQNGEDLVDEENYLDVVDGIGREDIYYGYDDDDQATPAAITQAMESKLDILKNSGKLVLTIDYASTQSKIDDAYQKSTAKGYVPYVALRDLDQIFDNGHIPDSASSNDAGNWSDVQHFLYFLQ
jgi:cysteinyl-tRNA synthetase